MRIPGQGTEGNAVGAPSSPSAGIFRRLPGRFPSARPPPAVPVLAAMAVLLNCPPLRGAGIPEGPPGELYRAESEALQARLDAPGRNFVVDGGNVSSLGAMFYLEPSGRLRWGEPLLRRMPEPMPAVPPSDAGGFFLRAGNEVGDPHLLELLGETAPNRTPFLEGLADIRLGKGTRLRAGFQQNDHFSYARASRRIQAAGGARPEDLAWFGANAPPYSLARAVVEAEGLGRAWFDQGWWWTFSRATGLSYPWQGHLAGMEIESPQGARFSLAHQAASHPAQWYGYRETEVLFRATPLLGRVGLDLSAGWNRRALRADTLFRGFSAWDFPVEARWRAEDTLSTGAALALSGALALRERSLFGENRLEAVLKAFGGSWSPGVEAWGLLAPDPGAVVREIPFGPGTESSAAAPAPFARGAGLSLTHRRPAGPGSLRVTVRQAGEWGAPLFRPAEIRQQGTVPARAGLYAASSHMLWIGDMAGEYSFAPFTGAELRLGGGSRGLAGKDSHALEYRPSPYWGLLVFTVEWPSALATGIAGHYVGERLVRGWGGDFRSAAHWEWHVGARQSLLKGRMLLHCAALNVFSDDVREHPVGNPLRFRILAAAEARF